MARLERTGLPSLRSLFPHPVSGRGGPGSGLPRLPGRPSVRRGPFPVPLPGGGPGGYPGGEIRPCAAGGRRRGAPPFPGHPYGVGGPFPGPAPSGDRPGTDPTLEIFPSRVQSLRPNGATAGPAHRVVLRSAPASSDPGRRSAGRPSALPAGRQCPGIVRRFPGSQDPGQDPPARRRLHLRGHGGRMRPCLETGRGRAYSGRDGRPRRPIARISHRGS